MWHYDRVTMPAYSQIHHKLIKYKLKANADSLPRYQKKKKKFLHLLVPCYLEWTHKCQVNALGQVVKDSFKKEKNVCEESFQVVIEIDQIFD